MNSQGFDTEPDTLSYKKDLVSDWKALLTSDLKNPDFYFPDIDFIEKLRKEGSVLDGTELADAAAFIRSSARLKQFCLKEPENIVLSGRLKNEAEKLPELSACADAIMKEIDSDGSVKENHPLLRAARARIASLFKEISRISSGYLNENREVWQSAVPSQRDGRTVLAIKTNYRSRVKGLVHELSSSGATVFIEPFDLVELNNDLTYEQSQLNQQVIKIYRALTVRLRESVETFSSIVEQIYWLDSWFARARYGIETGSIRPDDIPAGILIKNGRHPLLGESAVPISISYDEKTVIMIITGPNAGGKTVTLKTCGLFVLLNQFACELPAGEGTAIGLYDRIFADIGDDQSIEQSLSTFSGHMSRISAIASEAGERSLVLLDELGSGTDPSQGSAIAMGVLEYLRSRAVSTIVTTHHAAVKNFGYTHEGAVNASVAFDAATMKPTYEIIQGIPGESHAIEIAQACGLEPEIIRKAEDYMEGGDATVSQMIKELESRQHDMIERERRMFKEEKLLKEQRRELDLHKLRLRQAEYNQKNSEYGVLKRYVEDSRKELENLVRELREGEITREKTLKVKSFISGMDEQLEGVRSGLKDESQEISELSQVSGGRTEDEEVSVEAFEAGMRVKYSKTSKDGTLVEKRKNGEWIVAFGNIKLNIAEANLVPLKKKKEEKVRISAGGYSASAVFELDIRGMRVFEAETALTQQIDSALLSGVTEFSIIHGLGEGILMKAVHDFLRSCSAVRDFSFSDPEQGGFGKTVVKL